MWITYSLLVFQHSRDLNNKIISKPSKDITIPDNLYQVIIGITLGDAYIFRHKTENASFHIEQSYKNEKYLNHLYDLLKDYCKSQPVIRTRVDKKNRWD